MPSAIDQQYRMAAAWARGTDVNWQELYAAGTVRRVSLPTYAFAEDRYSMPGSQIAQTDPAIVTIENRGQAGGPANGTSAASPNYVAPRNETERRMAEIWSEILGVNGFGIHDDFFERGGNSILELQLVNRLAMESFDCSVRDLFDCPTIYKMSQRAIEAADSADLPARDFPLLPIQTMLIGRKPATDSSSRDDSGLTTSRSWLAEYA